jgi:TonB family protein
MSHSLYIGKEPSLHKIIIISAIVHLLFISVAVIPFRTGKREFKSYQVKLVGPIQAPAASRARGTVPVAKKKTLSPKKIRKKLPPKTLVKKQVKKQPKADMTLQQMARVSKEIERMRAISNLSKRKRDREGAKEVEVVGKKTGEATAGVQGIPGNGSETAPDSYYSLITSKIWGQWVYPDPASTGLETVVSIKIDKKGRIVSREVEKSSGNRLFDRYAAKALSNASPLPPPPFEMEIGVRFYQ